MKRTSNSQFGNALSKTFDEYCTVSSIHGMTFFKDKTTSKCSRITWAITILLMIFVANKMAISLYKGFMENPVRMVIETDHAISAKIYFPAVTVCPRTLFNHSKAIKLIETFKLPPGISERMILENLYQTNAFLDSRFKPSNTKVIALKDVMRSNNYTLMQFLSKTLWDCGELFFRCRFQSKIVNCSEVFRISKSYAGFCCSFNSKMMTKSPDFQYFKSNRHGLRQGLSLIFKDVEFDAEQLNSNNQRFQMFIHRPTAYLDGLSFRKVLHRNEEILLRFDPTETTCSDEVWKRLTPHERNCTLLSETPLQFFQNYNRQNCESECLSNIISKICNCIPFNLFAPENSVICDIDHIFCVSNNIGLIMSLLFKCYCLDSCNKIEYAVRLTGGSIEQSVDVVDPFYDGFHRNFTVVHVFLQSQEYRRIRRDIVWNIVSLAGNLGNCYSVFVGISAISIFELLYYLTFVLLRNYRNSHLENKKLFRSRRRSTLKRRKM